MSLSALALILLSAGFHAAWNALVKVSRDKPAYAEESRSARPNKREWDGPGITQCESL